jgi:hypothetical protein
VICWTVGEMTWNWIYAKMCQSRPERMVFMCVQLPWKNWCGSPSSRA